MTTELIQYSNDQPKFSIIRDGVNGNMDIVGRMIDLVKDSTVLDKPLEDLIKQRLHANNLDSYSSADDIFNYVYDFVKYGDDNFSGVDYIQDVQGRVESIKDARTTLQDGYGDCDDFSVLYATILSLLGFQPCFVIARYPDQETFSHIYTVAYADDKRYVFDGIIPNGHLNSEADGLVKQEICVYDDTNEFNHPVRSIVRNIKNLVTQTKRNAIHVAPNLAGFLPASFLVKQAARNVFSGLQDVQSLNELGSQLSGEISDITIRLQNGNVTKEAALNYALQRYSKLFSIDQTGIDVNAFHAIEIKLQNKINYIKNFVPYGDRSNVSTNTGLSTGAYITIGIVGLGIWYFYKHSNI